ncbi:protein yceG [Streptomyces laurentii]|uniref:Endolytic murein transglycosylase n=1 Tax=Streptomyces laurentii TaxID=39478 RepID=A0A169N5N8_STRLU|nr:protein yceG [Streptomyces laurentii]
MTEYGRSPGSEPWHPQDPLYGDQGWDGQQQQQYPQQATYGQTDPYAGDAYQQYPQQEQQQYAQQDQQQYPQEQHQQQYPQQYAQEQYPQQSPQEQAYGGQQQYGNQGGYDANGYPVQQQSPESQPQYDGNWETGQAAMPYNAPPADPYGGQQQPDLYGTPEAYPPPQPPGHRQAPPEPVDEWDADPESQEEHPFFTGGGDDDGDGRDDHGGRGAGRGDRAGRGRRGARDDHDDAYDKYDEEDDDEEPGRGSRSGRGGKGKKGRKAKNGVACLVVTGVILGAVGGVGYFGYKFYQGRFAAAPDYVGEGSGDVQVEIPGQASGSRIGNILKKAGVVKSVDAFVSAQQRNPKGLSIQAGVYTMKKEMSAASAVALMLNPASQTNFIIPEGKRNSWVYAQIDKRLDLEPGTTKDIAFKDANKLGLPDWAKNRPRTKDPLEGFLYPSSYPVAKGTKPEDVLRRMVAHANGEYGKLDLQKKASALGVKGPWELLTIASMVQAEGKTDDDFRKMAEVVYNRLADPKETVYLIQFDSTYNYLKGQSEIKLTEDEVKNNKDPYNTYTNTGLPPGPIGNPGDKALAAMLDPTHDGWKYFVATDGKNKTEFAKTHDEFLRLKDKFNAGN